MIRGYFVFLHSFSAQSILSAIHAACVKLLFFHHAATDVTRVNIILTA